MRKCFTIVAAFAMTILAAQSQAATNFSGEWKLNLAKSDYGPIQQFAPEFIVRTIKHDDPSFQVSTHQKGAHGEVTTELKYTTDGKPAENKGSKGTAKWEGDKIVMDSVRDSHGAELKTHEVLDAVGRWQNHDRKQPSDVPQGEFDLVYVFDKQ